MNSIEDAGAVNMPGSRQHVVPASVIGSFSLEASGARRKRKVVVASCAYASTKVVSAGSVGWEKDLFTLTAPDSEDPTMIDQMWGHVENLLPRAIDYLHTPVEALHVGPFVGVLVRYCAQQFVRSRDYDESFEARFDPAFADVLAMTSPDNSRHARMLDLQRLLFAVLDAHWLILHNTSSVPFVLNDCGFSVIGMGERHAYFFPFDPNTAAILTIGPAHHQLYPLEAPAWVRGPTFQQESDAGAVAMLNGSTFLAAIKEIYGSDETTVADAVRRGEGLRVQPVPLPRNGELLVPSAAWARDHEMTYYSILSACADSIEEWRRGGD